LPLEGLLPRDAVVARNEDQARRDIFGGDWGWALLGVSETKRCSRSTRTRLIRTREEWGAFVGRFGMTARSAEKRIRLAQAFGASRS
jgi:hypothetical protein